MPLEVVSTDGRTFRYREYVLPALAPNDVRVRVEFAAPKHGTELHSLTGSPSTASNGTRNCACISHGPNRSRLPSVQSGTWWSASCPKRGQRSRVTRRATASSATGPFEKSTKCRRTPGGRSMASPKPDAVCSDPAHVALVAVRDGNVRIGDAVAVFGLGAIGLMTVQIAACSGATTVIAVDPIEGRRARALALGADLVVDPSAEDAGLRIKRATGNHGVDVAIETSGAAAALHQAIRAIRQCGTIVHVPFGPKDASTLQLDEEFHLNRPTIIGSQAVWRNPDRSYPLWDEERARVTAIDLFRRGIVTSEGIVTPIVGFPDAAQALADGLAAPDRAIKIGVRFP